MSDYNSKSKKDSLTRTKIVHVEIDIRSEFWQELKTTCDECGWETANGLPVILAIGLSALQGQRGDPSNAKKNEDLKSDTRISDEAEQDIGS
jgi:hypothetical protein